MTARADNASAHRGLPAIIAWLTIVGSMTSPAVAAEVTIAVAANFSAPMAEIATAFAAATGHRVLISAGSTGVLYAQITQGAPFEVLLSADQDTPALLEQAGLAVPGSRRTYAIGRLILWSARTGFADGGADTLRHGRFAHLAMADPDLAPYGGAARDVLIALALSDALAPRLVIGQNVSQTFQFVASGNAELGFVARSQVWRDGKLSAGSGWLVPQGLHRPLRQDAVLLRSGADNPAAAAFLEYLAEPAAIAIMAAFGYEQES